jgi:hypothetical protein
VMLLKSVPVTSAATCRSTVTVHSSFICNNRQTTIRLISFIHKSNPNNNIATDRLSCLSYHASSKGNQSTSSLIH